MGFATYNPADASAGIVLSNGNLTVTSSANADNAVRANQFYKTGKFYIEDLFTHSLSGDTGWGFASSAAILTSVGNTVVNAAFVYGSGNLWINGTNTGSIGTSFGSTDIGCIAIDLVNAEIWARKNGGSWNNSGTADPASNVGGRSIAGFFTSGTTEMFAAIAVASTTDIHTTNLGASAFSQSVPVGFTSGWPIPSLPRSQFCNAGF